MLTNYLGQNIINGLANCQGLLYKNRIVHAIIACGMAIVPFSILRGLLVTLVMFGAWIGHPSLALWFDQLNNAMVSVIPLTCTLFIALHWSVRNRLSQVRCVTISMLSLLLSSHIINNDPHFYLHIHIVVAILSAIISCRLLEYSDAVMNKYTTWSESDYNFLFMLSISLVLIIVNGVGYGLLLNYIINGQHSLASALSEVVYPSDVLHGALYVLAYTSSWFFGINGYYIIMGIDQHLTMSMHSELLAHSNVNLLNPVFFDTWCNAGGTGMTLCLVLNILFSGKKSYKGLLGVSLPLALFNINEPLIFGIPIVLNPLMIVPFVLVPLMSFTLAWGATVLGIVPPVTHLVNWSTPSLLKVWNATGHSESAVALHAVIIILGVMIYRPFYLRAVGKNLRSRRRSSSSFLPGMAFHPTDLELVPDHKNVQDNIERREAWRHINALQRKGNFILYFQPQVRLSDKKIVGVEALIRYRADDGTISGPAFLKYYDRLGLMAEIDFWVMENAMAWIRKRLPHVRDMTLSINVSPQTLLDDRMLKMIKKVLNDPLPAGWTLELEITESQAMEDVAKIQPVLEKISGQGIHIALDDFGSGYSTISHLIHFPLDKIKLDRNIVTGLQRNGGYRFLERIVGFCTVTGCTILIEGVETEEELKLVGDSGVEVVQGFLFYPPLSGDALKTLLETHNTPSQAA